MEPVLQEVKLCYSDGSVKIINQIIAYQLENIDDQAVSFHILNGRLTDYVPPIKQESDLKAIKECRYLLPCGICEKNDDKCSQFGSVFLVF